MTRRCGIDTSILVRLTTREELRGFEAVGRVDVLNGGDGDDVLFGQAGDFFCAGYQRRDFQPTTGFLCRQIGNLLLDLWSRDRKALIGPVNTLAEDLSTLRGKLGLN